MDVHCELIGNWDTHGEENYEPSTVSFIVLRTLLVIIAVFVLLVGIFKFRQCPFEQELPLFLILVGVGVAVILKACLGTISSCQRTTYVKTERNAVDTCNDILSLFLIFWCLTGSVWTFGILTTVDVQTPIVHDCDKLAYLCSLSLMIGIYFCSLIGLFMIIILTLYCYCNVKMNNTI